MTTRTTPTIRDFTTPHSSTPSAVKRDDIIYWTSTGIIASVMFLSALNFGFNPQMKGGFAHLGLPNWFRIELTIASLLGVFAVTVPPVSSRIKEFTYFGFGIVLISASVAHLSSGDSIVLELGHLTFFASLLISWLYFHKRRERDSGDGRS